MEITYDLNPKTTIPAERVLKLFEQAGISKPNWTADRLRKSISGSTAVVYALDGNELIGFGSAISDGAWIAYISQLAVKPDYQRQGIGKGLLEKMLTDLGSGVTVVVHSSEVASNFYTSTGFKPYSNVFVRVREN
ncbi:MAG: GNAT family N-acetyltransferase [Proteobacteria bacterium]|nr:MAG: GNAT family N-acetyltransferase [Pseudomonadota bacterium]